MATPFPDGHVLMYCCTGTWYRHLVLLYSSYIRKDIPKQKIQSSDTHVAPNQGMFCAWLPVPAAVVLVRGCTYVVQYQVPDTEFKVAPNSRQWWCVVFVLRMHADISVASLHSVVQSEREIGMVCEQQQP